MTHREPEAGGTPGIERLILADCERVEADHHAAPDGACAMCRDVYRRRVEWPCAAARAAARLRELCAEAPPPVPVEHGPLRGIRPVTPLPRRHVID